MHKQSRMILCNDLRLSKNRERGRERTNSCQLFVRNISPTMSAPDFARGNAACFVARAGENPVSNQAKPDSRSHLKMTCCFPAVRH